MNITPTAALAAIVAPPAIGAPWPGIDGVYAGIAKGEDGQPDHHLVRLNVVPAPMKWQAALDYAVSLGADLPTRSESALLYAHLREDTDTSDWHWTKTQCSSGSAWVQNFYLGSQVTNFKEAESLFRPVRRLPLQSFNPLEVGAAVEGDAA